MAVSTKVAEWIAESVAKEIIGDCSSYYVGMISADLGFQGASTDIGKLLAQIEAEIGAMLHEIMDYQQLETLSGACQEVASTTATLENYHKIKGIDPNVARTYMEGIQSAISKLDHVLCQATLDENCGIVALANWRFNNLGKHPTSVCEMLYADLQRIWGLRAKATYALSWASAEYNNPLGIDVAALAHDCITTINGQAQTVQNHVNNDFSKRLAALSSPVYQLASNGRTAETISTVSAFTWFGFDNPTNPVSEISAVAASATVYSIDWDASNQYGPTGYGYALNQATAGTLTLADKMGVGFFGTNDVGLPKGGQAIAMAMVGLGNELCPGLAAMVDKTEQKKKTKEVAWSSNFGASTPDLIHMYSHDNQPNVDIVANKFYTGLCEFEDEDYLSGWQNVPVGAPYAVNNSMFKTNIDLTSSVQTTKGQAYTMAAETYASVSDQYWDQRVVGCNSASGFPLPITGVCFLQRGNRWGYLAQCRMHLKEFNTKPFGGATTKAGIITYINNHTK